MNNLKVIQSYDWYSGKIMANNERVCSARDFFQARIDSMAILVDKKKVGVDSAIFHSIIGEIGNNCFDHNSGKWRGTTGAYFDYDLSKNYLGAVVADQGRGILDSLKSVLPHLKSDQEALDVALNKVISGRAPEKRGNGLKYVRKTVNLYPELGLYIQSGSAYQVIGQNGVEAFKFLEKKINLESLFGVFSFLLWKFKKK